MDKAWIVCISSFKASLIILQNKFASKLGGGGGTNRKQSSNSCKDAPVPRQKVLSLKHRRHDLNVERTSTPTAHVFDLLRLRSIRTEH